MKKLSVGCIIFVGVILISGCIGGEKTSSETSQVSPTTQQSDTQNHDLILKLSDLPEGFKFDNYNSKNYAVPKSCVVNYWNASPGCEIREYHDNLPIGNRLFGSKLGYFDNYGRGIDVDYEIYDTNAGLREAIDQMKTAADYQAKERGQDIKMGNPNIGEYSLWIAGNRTDNPDIIDTVISFVDKNSLVKIKVEDEKDKSLNEAMRIAKIVDSRLD